MHLWFPEIHILKKKKKKKKKEVLPLATTRNHFCRLRWKRAWNYAYLALKIQNFLMQLSPCNPHQGRGQPPGPPVNTSCKRSLCSQLFEPPLMLKNFQSLCFECVNLLDEKWWHYSYSASNERKKHHIGIYVVYNLLYFIPCISSKHKRLVHCNHTPHNRPYPLAMLEPNQGLTGHWNWACFKFCISVCTCSATQASI